MAHDRLGLVVVIAAEQPHLAATPIVGRRGPGLQRPIERREELRAIAAQRVERPGLDERLDRLPVALREVPSVKPGLVSVSPRNFIVADGSFTLPGGYMVKKVLI